MPDGFSLSSVTIIRILTLNVFSAKTDSCSHQVKWCGYNAKQMRILKQLTLQLFDLASIASHLKMRKNKYLGNHPFNNK